MNRSDDEEEELALLAVARKTNREKKQKNSRKIYVGTENLDRNTAGAYAIVVPALRELGENRHYRYFRMTSKHVDKLFDLIKVDITKKFNHRLPIPSKMRLMIALRYIRCMFDNKQCM
jgi:hypothetical protein